MFREVLLYYVEFFKEKRNLSILEKIMCYFILMGDLTTKEKIEEFILHFLWEGDGDSLLYFDENFKFFLCDLALCSSSLQMDKKINNIKKLRSS